MEEGFGDGSQEKQTGRVFGVVMVFEAALNQITDHVQQC